MATIVLVEGSLVNLNHIVYICNLEEEEEGCKSQVEFSTGASISFGIDVAGWTEILRK